MGIFRLSRSIPKLCPNTTFAAYISMFIINRFLITSGSVEKITTKYQQLFSQDVGDVWKSPPSTDRSYFSWLSVGLKNTQPKHLLEINFGLVSIELHPKTFVAFDIMNSLGVVIMQAIPKAEPFIEYQNKEQVFKVIVELPPLIPDLYKVSAWVGTHNTETLSWQKEIVGFEITESPFPSRSFPHSHNNGFMIPHSTLANG